MKIIRSNPLGFGIHSPFVYHLVTKVIFSPGNCLLAFPFASEKKKAMFVRKMINRLTDYIHPEIIIIFGPKENLPIGFPEIEERFKCLYPSKLSDIAGNFKRSLFLINAVPENTEIHSVQSKEAYWILLNCNDLKMRQFLNNCKNSEKVSVTIEVFNTGIIIFSEIFQKQNYIILDWFRYLLRRH